MIAKINLDRISPLKLILINGLFVLALIFLVIECALAPDLFIENKYGGIGCWNPIVWNQSHENPTTAKEKFYADYLCRPNYVQMLERRQVYWFGRIENLTALN